MVHTVNSINVFNGWKHSSHDPGGLREVQVTLPSLSAALKGPAAAVTLPILLLLCKHAELCLASLQDLEG